MPKSNSKKRRSTSEEANLKPGQLDKRAKRQARHDEDVMFRAALLQWLPRSHIRESLTMVLPTEVMAELTALTASVSRWLLFNPGIIQTHLWDYLSGDCLPAVRRLNKHWAAATKACPQHPDQLLYLDTVLRDWKAYSSKHAGKRRKRENFFRLHKRAFVGSRHWILRSMDLKGWEDFAHHSSTRFKKSMSSRLDPIRASLVSFEVWYRDRDEVVSLELQKMTGLHHLKLFYPGASHEHWNTRMFKFYDQPTIINSSLRSLVLVPIKPHRWGDKPLKNLLKDYSQLRMLALGSVELTAEDGDELLENAPQLQDIRVAGNMKTSGMKWTAPRHVMLEVYTTGTITTEGRDSQWTTDMHSMTFLKARVSRHQRYCVDRVNERLRLCEWRLRK